MNKNAIIAILIHLEGAHCRIFHGGDFPYQELLQIPGFSVPALFNPVGVVRMNDCLNIGIFDSIGLYCSNKHFSVAVEAGGQVAGLGLGFGHAMVFRHGS